MIVIMEVMLMEFLVRTELANDHLLKIKTTNSSQSDSLQLNSLILSFYFMLSIFLDMRYDTYVDAFRLLNTESKRAQTNTFWYKYNIY